MNENLTVVEIRIKFLRELKGLTQWELAEKIGVSRSVINSWENGYANISLRKLVKLSYYFQVPIDYILGLITEFNKSDYNFREDLDLKYLGRNIRIIRITFLCIFPPTKILLYLLHLFLLLLHKHKLYKHTHHQLKNNFLH